jgi:hypothetical protein
MGDLVHFYSINVGDESSGPGETGPARAAETGAIPFALSNFADFNNGLKTLKDGGHKISRMVIETHGTPGALYFAKESVGAAKIQSLDGVGYEQMFEGDARIFLNGCNIAETECSTGSCGPSGNGRQLLTAVARVFLRQNGGRVGASTSSGIPIYGNKIYHITPGTRTVYALIGAGGGTVRIAVGPERADPIGQWKVTLSDGSVEFYWFNKDGTIAWDDGKLIFGESGKGTWSSGGGKVSIAWASGGREAWDLPIYSGEQSGVWTTAGGVSTGIVAEKMIDSNRLID